MESVVAESLLKLASGSNVIVAIFTVILCLVKAPEYYFSIKKKMRDDRLEELAFKKKLENYEKDNIEKNIE